jgi:hypothetical protein
VKSAKAADDMMPPTGLYERHWWELDILLGKREILSGRKGDSVFVEHRQSSGEGKEVF